MRTLKRLVFTCDCNKEFWIYDDGTDAAPPPSRILGKQFAIQSKNSSANGHIPQVSKPPKTATSQISDSSRFCEYDLPED